MPLCQYKKTAYGPNTSFCFIFSCDLFYFSFSKFINKGKVVKEKDIYLAFPPHKNQITSDKFSKYATFVSKKKILKDEPLLTSNCSIKNERKVIVSIIEKTRLVNKKINIIAYDHSAPPPLPLNLIYDNFSPDKLLVTGKAQINFYTKYMMWPKSKLELVPTLRFKNEECVWE